MTTLRVPPQFLYPANFARVITSARLGLAADLPPLQWISGVMVWVVFAAWLVALFGPVRRLVLRPMATAGGVAAP